MHATQFWSIATLMVIATTALLVVPLYWRTPRLAQDDAKPARRWPAFALAAALPLAALSLYFAFGSPSQIDVPPARPDAARAHAPGTADGMGGDLDDAIERLRTRLAAEPGDADGWRLLAQSYRYLGRESEAAAAMSRALALAGGAPSAQPRAQGVDPEPLDAEALRIADRAQSHRKKREFAQAVAAFESLARRGTMTADLWADYADALGSARGSLEGEAAKCIAAALRLDARHPKALWLEASRLTTRSDYRGALEVWNTLAAVLPPDSPDARVIAGNIEEARSKLAVSPQRSPAPIAVALHGSVRLDPRWIAEVPPGTTLFIFARAADERGPPLAVLRTAAGPWPVRFTLDDTNAMLPSRALSNYSRVILEARISRSGDAAAKPGDLRAVSAVLDPRSAAEQQLVIDERVGPSSPQGS